MKMHSWTKPGIITGTFLWIIFLVGCTAEANVNHEVPDLCNANDTNIIVPLGYDSSGTGFDRLSDFIESKGELNRVSRKGQTYSVTADSTVLRHLMCEEKYYDSPKETWIFPVFSETSRFYSKQALANRPDLWPEIEVTQINFVTNEEKELVYRKIKTFGWGDPLSKWNDYWIINKDRKIIVVESRLAAYSYLKQKYADLIESKFDD